MDEICHCGSPMKGSDHCPFCYCEQYERECEAVYDEDETLGVDNSWRDNYYPLVDYDR